MCLLSSKAWSPLGVPLFTFFPHVIIHCNPNSLCLQIALRYVVKVDAASPEGFKDPPPQGEQLHPNPCCRVSTSHLHNPESFTAVDKQQVAGESFISPV